MTSDKKDKEDIKRNTKSGTNKNIDVCRKDAMVYDGPEKPDAYMGNDRQWVVRAFLLAFIDVCIMAASFFFALMIRFEFAYSHIPDLYLAGYIKIAN